MKPKNKLIIQQALRIAELETENANYKDGQHKRDMWLDKAKRDAGADIRESFDRVWERALAALKSTQA